MNSFLPGLIPILIALGIVLFNHLDVHRKKIRFLELKVDALTKHAGINFNESSLVPKEVHKAIENGQRMKAIRLYRQITGAGLQEASDIVTDLFKQK